MIYQLRSELFIVHDRPRLHLEFRRAAPDARFSRLCMSNACRPSTLRCSTESMSCVMRNPPRPLSASGSSGKLLQVGPGVNVPGSETSNSKSPSRHIQASRTHALAPDLPPWRTALVRASLTASITPSSASPSVAPCARSRSRRLPTAGPTCSSPAGIVTLAHSDGRTAAGVDGSRMGRSVQSPIHWNKPALTHLGAVDDFRDRCRITRSKFVQTVG
jgi:hypothetical protein